MKDEIRDADRSGADDAARPPVVVKKYANRRLYNTATSSYVTLDNLAVMVRDGQDFVVQDAKSGEDITRSVLTQIIFEEESRGREPLLPTSVLRQLIRLYGDALRSYFPGYLEVTMQAFERNQEAFRSQMERSFGKGSGFAVAQFDAMTRANMDVFRNAMSMFAPFAAAAAQDRDMLALPPAEPSSDTAEGSTPPAASAEEIDALRRELAEMQKKLEALSKT